MGDYVSHFAPEEPHSVGRGSLKEEDQNLVLVMLEYVCHCVVKEYLALSSISENIKSLPLFRALLYHVNNEHIVMRKELKSLLDLARMTVHCRLSFHHVLSNEERKKHLIALVMTLEELQQNITGNKTMLSALKSDAKAFAFVVVLCTEGKECALEMAQQFKVSSLRKIQKITEALNDGKVSIEELAEKYNFENFVTVFDKTVSAIYHSQYKSSTVEKVCYVMGIEKVLTTDPFHMIEGQTTGGSTADGGSNIPTIVQQLNARETSMQSNPAQEVSGQSNTVQEVSGQSNTVQEVSGQSNTVQEVSGQSNTVQEVSGQSNTVQEVSGQSNTVQEVSGQSNTVQEVNVQSKTELVASYPATGSKGGSVVSPSLGEGDLDKDITGLGENKNGTSLVSQEMNTRSDSQNVNPQSHEQTKIGKSPVKTHASCQTATVTTSSVGGGLTVGSPSLTQAKPTTKPVSKLLQSTRSQSVRVSPSTALMKTSSGNFISRGATKGRETVRDDSEGSDGDDSGSDYASEVVYRRKKRARTGRTMRSSRAKVDIKEIVKSCQQEEDDISPDSTLDSDITLNKMTDNTEDEIPLQRTLRGRAIISSSEQGAERTASREPAHVRTPQKVASSTKQTKTTPVSLNRRSGETSPVSSYNESESPMRRSPRKRGPLTVHQFVVNLNGSEGSGVDEVHNTGKQVHKQPWRSHRASPSKKGKLNTSHQRDSDDFISDFEETDPIYLPESPGLASPSNFRPVKKVLRHLDSNGARRRVKWTNDEVHLLKKGVVHFGVGKWKSILENYPFSSIRTSVDLKDKWRNLPSEEKQAVLRLQ